MKTIVLFGAVHKHTVNGIDYNQDTAAVIDADDYTVGRERAFKLFGPAFSHTTDERGDMVNDLRQYTPGGFINVDTGEKEFES